MGFPYSSGDVLTAADMNAIGSWQDYTPTLTNISGTINFARFCEINQTVVVHFSMTLDAAVTGTIAVAAPVQFAGFLGGTGVGQITIGTALAIDASSGSYGAPMFVRARGSQFFRFSDFSVASSTSQQADANAPFSWASGDSLRFSATYKRSDP